MGKGRGPEKGRNMKKWYASGLWNNLKKEKTDDEKRRSKRYNGPNKEDVSSV